MNKVLLIGNVCQEPQVKNFDNGKVANVRLATNVRAHTKKDGTKSEEMAEYHNLVFINKQADLVESYVKKGDKIYVEGKLRTRAYESKGEKKYVTEIVVNEIEFLNSKNSSPRISDDLPI